MKSLMTFMGILAFNLPNIAMSSDFSCPVNANASNFTCSGTVKVKTLAELNSYVNNLGVVAKKPTIAKNLQIDFNPALTSDLVISTPCLIKIPKDIVMTSTANICLHGTKGVSIDENFKFTGKNLKLESKEEVIINKNSVIKAQDIKLLSIGSGDTSKTYIREAANIEAANLSIESFDKGFVGKNSIVKLTGALGIYSLGDDEASVREGARVEAAKIEISSTEETRIAKSTTLIATEIILNGVKCTINKTAVITAQDRLGNCFLSSTTNKAKFSISKNQGTNPLTVNFNGSSIADAKGFIWSFGDGETLNSLTPSVTHIYNRVGSFTATLKYATKDNYKGLKSAGAIQIDVKEAPIFNPVVPVPPRGNLKYQTDGTFVYLRGYIRKTTYDIANAYYVIDDNQDNKIQIPNFYQNSLTSVEMNTYGRHKVTMNVIDVQGLTHSKSMNVYTGEDESDVYPYMRLDVDQSAARTMFFDLSWSFNPIAGETLKNFKIDFGDGQSAILTDSAFFTHTYAQAGTYLVRGTGSVNGNEDFDEYEIEVTDENTPIMNPVAGFEYQIYNSAGNVVFTDDRSGTPNGEIISYAWDFGDGTVGYGKNASIFYAPGEYLVTLTVTDTAGMRSSQTQKITIVDPGVEIAAVLNCWSEESKHLECRSIALDKFNQITRVKLDWGDGTSENLTTADIPVSGQSKRKHIYENFGTYEVKLTVDTSRGQSVYAYHEEIFDQSSNTPTALLECYVFRSQVNCVGRGSSSPIGNIVNYKFDFGNGVVSENTNGEIVYFYHENGSYVITLSVTDTLGQVATHTFNVVIVNTIPPIANIQCSINNLLIMCDALGSYDSSGSSLVYEFNMGDGILYSNETGVITHSYIQAGLYPVQVKVTNKNNLSSYDIKYYQAVAAPQNLAPEIRGRCIGSKPYVLDCDFSASVDDGYIVSYSIKFDEEAALSAVPIFSHRYQTAGEKDIIVTVMDNEGKSSVLNATYYVNPSIAPSALFECRPSRIFDFTCYALGNYGDSDNSIIEYAWNMGDSSEVIKGMLPTVEHTYVPGTYKIKLTVKNQYGDISSSEQEFIVLANQPPIASVSCEPWGSPVGDMYTCQGRSSDSDGQIVKRYITIEGKIHDNDGTGNIYFNGGDTVVYYTVVDSNGAEVTAQTVVTIPDRPKLEYSCIQNKPYHISCNILELPKNEGYRAYAFRINGADIVAGTTLEYDAVTSGPVNIEALAFGTISGDIVATKGFNISEVYQPPSPVFIAYVDIDNRVKFDALGSYMQDRKIQSFRWDFGDGQTFTATDEKVQHTYSASGNYSVSLTITDLNGASKAVIQNIDVYIQEVPDPGIENEATVIGVDVDADNVRDDIQRWISYEAKGNSELKELLKKLARTYQIQVANSFHEGIIVSQENRKNNIETCLFGKVADDKLSYYYLKMTEHFYKSTRLRNEAYIRSMKYSWAPAISYTVPENQGERLLKCSEI